MVQLNTWLGANFALLHGEDSDGRRDAIEAWKATHVDLDWGEFSFSLCNEYCSWSEIVNALRESAPMGADRVVMAPHVDNLFEKGKKLPNEVKQLLTNPLAGTKLLLVACSAISAAPGSILNSKPFSDWGKQGSILKVDILDDREVVNWIERVAKDMNLRLSVGAASLIAGQLGNNPGILRRTLEFLELSCDGKSVTVDHINGAIFRIGEQGTFAWIRAWQSGSVHMGLQSLRQALEDDPSSSRYLMLIGQARREIERLCCLSDARRSGVNSRTKLLTILGLSHRQDFLLSNYSRILDKIGEHGLKWLIKLINQTELDVKGQAVSRCSTTLVNLTVVLCRVWDKQHLPFLVDW